MPLQNDNFGQTHSPKFEEHINQLMKELIMSTYMNDDFNSQHNNIVVPNKTTINKVKKYSNFSRLT